MLSRLSTIKLIVIFIALSVSQFTFASNKANPTIATETSFEKNDWQLISKKNDDLKVFTKHIPNYRLKAVKTSVTINASLEDILIVLSDINHLSDWVPYLYSSETLKQPNTDGISYLYFVSKFPWPIKNRDLILKTVASYNPENKTVHINSNSVENYNHKGKIQRLIRIPYSKNHLSLKSLSAEQVYIELISHSDPGGDFPEWLANYLFTKIPKKTLSRLKKEIAKEQKKERDFDLKRRDFDLKKVFGREVLF